MKIKNWSTTEALYGNALAVQTGVSLWHTAALDKAADTVTDYVLFCEEMIIPKRTPRLFPNNRPWITDELKSLLNEKRECFKQVTEQKVKRFGPKLHVQFEIVRWHIRIRLKAFFPD